MAKEDLSIARAARFAELGHEGNLDDKTRSELEGAAVGDLDARARSSALGALVRSFDVTEHDVAELTATWLLAVRDVDAAVRRRAGELGPKIVGVATVKSVIIAALIDLLGDEEITVIETAAWALGECDLTSDQCALAVSSLAQITIEHDQALVREAAAAALGALGDPNGLPAILVACTDKPAVRRRAVLALAPFSGPEVEAAIEAATQDRDPQVRRAAEILLQATKE